MALGKISATIFGLLAIAVVAPVAPASADSGSAADIVGMLQAQGYSVQFNMPSEMALYRCTVSGVRGIPVMMMSDGALMMSMGTPNPNTTVYVDLDCPNSNN